MSKDKERKGGCKVCGEETPVVHGIAWPLCGMCGETVRDAMVQGCLTFAGAVRMACEHYDGLMALVGGKVPERGS